MQLDTKISDLRNRVSLCTMHDVVEQGGVMTLSRTSIASVWAAIYAQPHLQSFISPYGYAIQEKAERPTHLITVRYKVDLDFTSAAWVYEERRKSPPRWYKVLGFYDNENWIVIHAHLVQRSEQASPPQSNRLAADASQI
ncbi:phage head completion protein [Bradyrhizobium sp. USDA 10063]